MKETFFLRRLSYLCLACCVVVIALRIKSAMFPMHNAAERGDFQLLSSLKEFDINAKTFDGITALHRACSYGQVNCVEFLIQNGANVNITDVDGGTPLCEACAMGHIGCAKVLLQAGADLNPPVSRTSPLHEAAISGNSDCAKLLLEAGAKLHVSDCHYGTPLHAAASLNCFECVVVLLRYGSEVNALHIHKTALHLAAKNNSLSVVKVLLEYGADVYAQNYQEKRASEICQPQSEIFHLLKHFESNPRPLVQLCKLVIRKIAGRKGIFQLGLPSRLLSYIE